MNLQLDLGLAINYKSMPQKIRVITEPWILNNSYCPNCGSTNLIKLPNNEPVADFKCANCSEEYELKSKSNSFGKIVTDGAYNTMVQRLQSDTNPNFLFLTYTKEFKVNNLMVVPKYFVSDKSIIKRQPLSTLSKRSRWTGCNIDLSKIPQAGKILIIDNTKIVSKTYILELFKRTLFIKTKSIKSRTWLFEIMQCIDLIPQNNFTLADIYKFESLLQNKYPTNQHIKDKIRQQLQLLRDMNIIEFKSRGNFSKIF